MTKPLAYLRDRPIGVLALAMAYKRVLLRARSGLTTSTGANGINNLRVESCQNACISPGLDVRQMRLPIDEPATTRI